MDEGIDAERAVLADQPRRHPLEELEARPPHQRAIAEHPEVTVGKFRFGEGGERNGGHFANRYQNSLAKRSGFGALRWRVPPLTVVKIPSHRAPPARAHLR